MLFVSTTPKTFHNGRVTVRTFGLMTDAAENTGPLFHAWICSTAGELDLSPEDRDQRVETPPLADATGAHYERFVVVRGSITLTHRDGETVTYEAGDVCHSYDDDPRCVTVNERRTTVIGTWPSTVSDAQRDELTGIEAMLHYGQLLAATWPWLNDPFWEGVVPGAYGLLFSDSEPKHQAAPR